MTGNHFEWGFLDTSFGKLYSERRETTFFGKYSESEEACYMSSTYITITGLNHYFGSEFIEPGMTVKLVKEPDNEFDHEAIRVEMGGIGKIGYVANSTYTVQGESMSAGRLYDRIGDTAKAIVKLVLPCGVLCKVKHLIPLPENKR